MSATTKTMIAAAAALTAAFAFAQGTPPAPAANPAVGSGQTSTQATPMGATGTPGGASASGSATGGSTMSSGTSSSGSTMSSGTAGSGSTMSSGTSRNSAGTGTTRTARADRN